MTAHNRQELFPYLVLDLGRQLRKHGALCTTTEILDGVAAVSLPLSLVPSNIRSILRTTLVKDQHDFQLFDRLFSEIWSSQDHEFLEGLPDQKELEPRVPERRGAHDESVIADPPSLVVASHEGITDGIKDEHGLIIYSHMESTSKKIFRDLGGNSRDQVRRALKVLTRKFATSPGRRYHNTKSGDLDFRRTFRESVGHGGIPMRMIRRKRKLQKTKVLVLFDVSGSMDEYGEKLLRTLFFMRKTLHNFEAFAFSTDLIRLTGYLDARNLEEVAGMISSRISVWGSGTRIGLSVNNLVEKYSYLLDKKTLILIISDGWDVGDIELLERGLDELRRRSGTILWLNPLVDKPGFQPLTLGMSTAKRYIDHLTSPNILEDPRELERWLGT